MFFSLPCACVQSSRFFNRSVLLPVSCAEFWFPILVFFSLLYWLVCRSVPECPGTPSHVAMGASLSALRLAPCCPWAAELHLHMGKWARGSPGAAGGGGGERLGHSVPSVRAPRLPPLSLLAFSTVFCDCQLLSVVGALKVPRGPLVLQGLMWKCSVPDSVEGWPGALGVG